MTGSVGIRGRRCGDRRDSVIRELSDGCVWWVIGCCVITPRQRSVSWIQLRCSSGGRAHDSSVRRQYDGSHYTGFPLYCCSAILSDIASVKSAQFVSGDRSCRPEGSGIDVSSAALSSTVVSSPHKVLIVDATSNLHPFFTYRLDAGPIWLATIAHAFNYRVAVLRDGVR